MKKKIREISDIFYSHKWNAILLKAHSSSFFFINVVMVSLNPFPLHLRNFNEFFSWCSFSINVMVPLALWPVVCNSMVSNGNTEYFLYFYFFLSLFAKLMQSHLEWAAFLHRFMCDFERCCYRSFTWTFSLLLFCWWRWQRCKCITSRIHLLIELNIFRSKTKNWTRKWNSIWTNAENAYKHLLAFYFHYIHFIPK